MKVLVVFSSFIFVTILAYSKGQDEPQFKRVYVDPKIKGLPKDIASRITNGEIAEPHSIPYQVFVVVKTHVAILMCGGSLISDRHILTAGHCVKEGITATVNLGAHNIEAPIDPSILTLESENLILHEEFDRKTIANDIGLIVLDEPVEFNENISAVVLPSRDSINDYEGANARVSGWGYIGEGEQAFALLRQANATVINNSACDEVFENIQDSQLCTFGAANQSPCNGDAGGPLIAGDVQIGIFSYGASGCRLGRPSVYTRVASYLDWIAEKTGLDV